MNPMPDVEVEIMLLNFLMFLIVKTRRYENDNKELIFLEVTIRNNLNHSYDLAVYCKPAITKVQIKSHSNIFPDIIMENLKGFYHAHCTLEKIIRKII